MTALLCLAALLILAAPAAFFGCCCGGGCGGCQLPTSPVYVYPAFGGGFWNAASATGPPLNLTMAQGAPPSPCPTTIPFLPSSGHITLSSSAWYSPVVPVPGTFGGSEGVVCLYFSGCIGKLLFIGHNLTSGIWSATNFDNLWTFLLNNSSSSLHVSNTCPPFDIEFATRTSQAVDVGPIFTGTGSLDMPSDGNIGVPTFGP